MIQLRRTYKLILLCCLTFFTTAVAVSQTMTQPEAAPALEEAAREQAEKWDEELSLTAKQLALMEDKIIEFAIKKDRILQSKMREEAKARELVKLQELENQEMRDILTKPQFDRYLMLQRQRIKQQGVDN